MVCLLLSAVLCLAGCAGPEPEAVPSPTPSPTPVSQTQAPVRAVEFALPYSVGGGFHPITGVNRTNLTLSPLLYEGLFAVGRDFQAQRVLCDGESVSEDGLVWTFHLRSAQFSDGSPVTARDVISSLETARSSENYAGRLTDILMMNAGSGGEVVITLLRPNGALPVLLDIPIVKETEDPARPMGTGPYVLEDGADGLRLAAKAGSHLPLSGIPLKAVETFEDLAAAFESQEISLVTTDLIGTSSVGWSGRYEITDFPASTLLYLGCNLKRGVCRYSEVRRALGLAIDRENMVGTVLSGHAVAAALPVHPSSILWDRALAETVSYQMDQAEAELLDGGWQRGEEDKFQKGRTALELRLVVNQENTYKAALADALAGSLETLGCVVTVEKLPWKAFMAALAEGDFDLYLGETTLNAGFSLDALVGSEGGLNYGGYANEKTEELLAEFRAARTGQNAAAASALCTHLATTAPVLPVCFKNGSVLTQWGQIQGLEPLPRNVFQGIETWTVGGMEETGNG